MKNLFKERMESQALIGNFGKNQVDCKTEEKALILS